MARSTLEAVFGALGAGLQGYGADKNLRMNREEERLRREEEARRAADQQRIQLFQSGLDVAAPLEQRAKTLGQSGALAGAAPSVPGMAASGLVGRALEQAGRNMGTDLTRGRRLTMGGVDYVQPFSRTAEGREEREQGVQARQAQIEQATRAAELETQFGRQKELIELQGREDRASRTGTGSGNTISVAGSLRDDWRQEPAVKRAEIIADQTRLVQAAAQNPDAAGDLSLIFAYMRILDPNSVVREREFANAQNAAGVPDQIRNLYNRALRGERLNDTQRTQFVSRATAIAKQSEKSLLRQSNRYTNIAMRYGIDPAMVVDNPFEGVFGDEQRPERPQGRQSGRPPISSFEEN
jgi:hypothetical protein